MAVSVKQNGMIELHGYAAADKEEGSRELLVYSEELLPFLVGELKAKEIVNEISTKSKNNQYVGQLKVTNTIKCIYKDDTSGDAFPPMVRKGEQVRIYNNADTDVWYWKSEGRNDNTRRTDLKRIHISATLEGNPELNDDNSYFQEFNTRTGKYFKISTSNKLGEKYRYLFKIDAETSTVLLCDDSGNMIGIDSNTPRVYLKNRDNSLLDLNQKSIVMACEKDITIMAKKGKCTIYSKDDMTLQTENNFSLTSTNEHTTKSGKKMSISTGETMTLTSSSDMIQQAGGSWSLSFKGTGTCNSVGGILTMNLGRFNINHK